MRWMVKCLNITLKTIEEKKVNSFIVFYSVIGTLSLKNLYWNNLSITLVSHWSYTGNKSYVFNKKCG